MGSSIQSTLLQRLELRYDAVSQLQSKEDGQTLYLVLNNPTEESKSSPSMKVAISDVTRFREVLSAFLSFIVKSLVYKPDSTASDVANTHFQKWLQLQGEISDYELHVRLFNMIQEYDSAALIGIDPLLTIRDGAVYLEAFSKNASRYISIILDDGFWQEEASCVEGTAHVCITRAFIASINSITPRLPLTLSIGTADELGILDRASEDTDKVLKKGYPITNEWLRRALLLQASSAQTVSNMSLMRMDLFNLVHYLRLHRAKVHKTWGDRRLNPKQKNLKEEDTLLFKLRPGQAPQMVLSPWKEVITYHGAVYDGEERQDIEMIRGRRDLLSLDRFMPYVKQAELQLFDTALHSSIEVTGAGFCVKIVSEGFQASDWKRRLQMETKLPAFSARGESSSVLETIHSTGNYKLSGTESLQIREELVAEMMRGTLFYSPSNKLFFHREWLNFDPEDLKYLGNQDRLAHEHVLANRVGMNNHRSPDGTLVFVASDGTSSSVREALKEGQEEASVFHPKFSLTKKGALLEVGCTCVHWKEFKEGGDLGGPCCHVRALWIHYLRDIERKKQSGEEEEVLFQTRRFVRKDQVRELVLDVSGKKKLTELWGDRNIFEERHRKSISIYPSSDLARSAYAKRCAYLTDKGYSLEG